MLILLYGKLSKVFNFKQQRMINGDVSCMYREYARKFGKIIYLCPQNVSLEWEHSIPNSKKVLEFLKSYPKAIIWSVKHDPKKDNGIINKINNKTLYYSCNSSNSINMNCNVSLIDTEKRLRKNGKLWVKGKDIDFWKPKKQKKIYDYILVGLRGDKNEIYFFNQLTSQVKEKRNVLWIGGKKFEGRFPKTQHNIKATDRKSQSEVRDLLSSGKVGICFTELKVEGLPQTPLEMQMCGLPVVYNINAPLNKFYKKSGNFYLTNKRDLIKTSEQLLKRFNPEKCRIQAVENFSLEKSYERLLECLNTG